MKKTNKKQTIIIATIAIIISITAIIISITSLNNETKHEWGCSLIDCAEFQEITGEQWARENCEITAQGTICLVVFDDGRTLEVPLDEINLSEITATKCTQYVCVEETVYRKVNYTLNIDEHFQR